MMARQCERPQNGLAHNCAQGIKVSLQVDFSQELLHLSWHGDLALRTKVLHTSQELICTLQNAPCETNLPMQRQAAAAVYVTKNEYARCVTHLAKPSADAVAKCVLLR